MNIYVKNSGIHGLGLFTRNHINIGDGIIVFEGEESDEWTPHLITIDSGSIEVTNNARYANHSITPNAFVSGNILFALTNIEPGEEITFDYGSDMEEEDGN